MAKEVVAQTDGQGFFLAASLEELIIRHGLEKVDVGMKVVAEVSKTGILMKAKEIRRRLEEAGIRTDGDDLILSQLVRAHINWGEEYFRTYSEQE